MALESKHGDGGPQCQELVFGLTDQLHEDAPLAATAAAETPHDLFEFLHQASRLALERGGSVLRRERR